MSAASRLFFSATSPVFDYLSLVIWIICSNVSLCVGCGVRARQKSAGGETVKVRSPIEFASNRTGTPYGPPRMSMGLDWTLGRGPSFNGSPINEQLTRGTVLLGATLSDRHRCGLRQSTDDHWTRDNGKTLLRPAPAARRDTTGRSRTSPHPLGKPVAIDRTQIRGRLGASEG